MLEKPGKLRAPKKFQPGPTPRSGIVEAFLARELNVVKTMDDSSSLDWSALRLVSPALPSFASLTTSLVSPPRKLRSIERFFVRPF